MAFTKKHAVGTLTAGVIALAAYHAVPGKPGFIPNWEGEQHHAVRNAFDPINPATGKKVVTVCNGHTDLDDPNLKEGDYYTGAMCADVLAGDLVKYNKDLIRYLGPEFPVSDHMHVALLSFDLNVGPGNFRKVAALLRAGHRKEGCQKMGEYTRANGIVLRGLHNRRYDQFLGEIVWCLRDD